MLKALLLKKAEINKKMPKKFEVIKGSLVSLKITCGKKNCRCYTKGEKHESLYLSQSKGGKTKMTYIPKRYEKQVREYIACHKQVQRNLEELSEVNIKIIKTQNK